MGRKSNMLLISLLLIILFIVSCKFWQYKKALNKQRKQYYDTSYIGKQFSGRIIPIDQFEHNSYTAVLGIDDSTEFDINYGVTCVDQKFNDFVAVGDSVFETVGSKYIKFCKSDKRCREIELNFCG